MRFILILAAIAAALTLLALRTRGVGWLLLWPAGSCWLVALAYQVSWPGVFGKRADGTMAWRAVLPTLPFLLATWSVWYAARLLRREPPAHEIRPGLWLGRRPYAREVPPGVDLVVDLTAEFPIARAIRLQADVTCLPTLDGTAPRVQDLRRAVDLIRHQSGGVIVHCASGRGRSTTIVAAYLIDLGEARTPHEAEAIIRAIRPGVRLTRPQRALLESLL